MTQLESGQQEDEEGRAKLEDEAERHAEVERLSVAAVDEAMDELAGEEDEPVRRGDRRPFTITKFGRHENGYFHARVTPRDGKPVYVHARFGSWLAPGTVNGKPVLKEVVHEVKVELSAKARAVEKAERKENGKEEGQDAEGNADGPGDRGSDASDDGDREGA